MRQDGEASVEEILESIKKVIARDNRTGAIETRRRRESDGLPEPADTDEAEEILDLGEADYVAEEAIPDPATSVRQEVDEADNEPLTAPAVRMSMQDNFAALAMLAEPGASPQIVRSGETSLEGLTRELLRPMLSEWLDKNLPGMVEKLVTAEIARIAGKRG
jgi:cell pole-organizing protein PopZ